MDIGLSTYSLEPLLRSGALSLEVAIDRAAAMGAQVLELVPFSFRFTDPQGGGIDADKIRRTRKRAADAGIKLCNYSVGANLLQDADGRKAETARLRREVEVAAELGLPRMRHDVGGFEAPHDQYTPEMLERVLPGVADAVSEISLYAKGLGVRTLLENHGFLFNGTAPVTRLLDAVKTGNYGLLLDTGNAACVDEDPQAFVEALAARCEMAHLKDFHFGDAADGSLPGGSHWFLSRGGRPLRGAVLGGGGLDVRAAVKALKRAGYAGAVAIEFEGPEEPLAACEKSLRFAREALDNA